MGREGREAGIQGDSCRRGQINPALVPVILSSVLHARVVHGNALSL